MWETIIPAAIALISSLAQQSKTNDVAAGWSGKDLNGGRSSDFYNRLSSGGQMDPMLYYGQARNNLASSIGAQNKAASLADRSGSAIMQELAGQQPGILDMAGNAAKASMNMGGSSLMDLARLASAQARANLANRLGGAGQGFAQGGALEALSRGSQEPLLQALAQLSSQQQSAFNNAYSNLEGLASQREFNRPSEYEQLAQGFNQQGSLAGSLGAQLASLLGGQSEQMLMKPQLQSSPTFASKIGGLAAGIAANNAGNFDWSSLFKGARTSDTAALGDALLAFQQQNPNDPMYDSPAWKQMLTNLGRN